RMAVVPPEADGVISDRLHPFELDVGADRFGLEDARAGPLVAARGAGALAAQVVVREPVRLAVVPGQFEHLLGLVGADVRGGLSLTHRSIRSGGCARSGPQGYPLIMTKSPGQKKGPRGCSERRDSSIVGKEGSWVGDRGPVVAKIWPFRPTTH